MAVRRTRRSRELRSYLSMIRRWFWFVLLCTVIAAVTAFVASELQHPVYRATTILIVDQRASGSDPYSGLLASDQLVSTYVTLIDQPVILQAAAKQVGGITEKNLASHVSVSNPGTSTQLIQVQVDDESPVRAAKLANTIASIFIQQQEQTTAAEFQNATQEINQEVASDQQQITSLNSQINSLQATNPANPQIQTLKSQLASLTQDLDALVAASAQLTTQELVYSHNIRVFETATPPTEPDHPIIRLNVTIGAAAGLILAIGLVVLLELLNNRIRTPEQAQELTGLPVIGSTKAQARRQVLLMSAKGSRLKQSFTVLLTNLSFIRLTKPLRTIVVTSAVPGEGKTITAINLATALAQSGKRVLLLDADLRVPRIHRYLGISNAGGLTHFLMQEKQPIHLENWQDASTENLYVLTAGPVPPNPLELLDSDLMKGFLQSLFSLNNQGQSAVDVVVIDTPPVCTFPDAAALSKSADGTILIVDRLVSREETVLRAQDALAQVHARIVGVFYNHVKRQQDKAYDYQDYGKRTSSVERAAVRSRQSAVTARSPKDADVLPVAPTTEGAAARFSARPLIASGAVEDSDTGRLIPPR